MLRNSILLGLLIGMSIGVPVVYQANPEAIHTMISRRSAQPDEPASVQIAVVDPLDGPSGAFVGAGNRKVEIAADERGHYTGAFRINGRKVDALVDTGATAVAINVSTARRLGVPIMASDLKDTVSTANGKTKATVVRIDRIEIGRIVVEGVPAIVLDDDSLQTSLIGMTFLSRLKRYESDGKMLQLVQ